MNEVSLKKAEKKFLRIYPGGFAHPEMVAIGKKHKMEKMKNMAKDHFSKSCFDDPEQIMTSLIKLVSSSSMVSMFEKPKFRDRMKNIAVKEKKAVSEALFEMLHGKQQEGFERFLFELQKRELAKWTLISVLPAYYKPKKEIFVKPNTTKDIISVFELPLQYKPLPSWAFYKAYRSSLNKMKKQVDPSLSPSNPAFTGFLMMSMS